MDQTESQSGHKWEGKVSTRVAKASADQIWPLFVDFFNLHKWFPGLSDCYGIHGKNGEPGCVRYCAGFSISSEGTSDPGENRPIKWSKERLVGVDPLGRSLNYEMVDSNNGFTSYASTVRVIPGDGDGEGGCTIEWSFTVDPVEGWVLEDLVRKYEVGLQGMGRKMEDSISVM
ncbi:lachrymatory-factor synthase [Eucalyptus grandis]|uniref:lachrymatory-factor synthase n=1 Tax=Eucalyptus grandis TaxID=71139 RepID=UPI00192E7FA4|nr:lachrymatory-factor synthase [Eucalyptus grandis]